MAVRDPAMLVDASHARAATGRCSTTIRTARCSACRRARVAVPRGGRRRSSTVDHRRGRRDEVRRDGGSPRCDADAVDGARSVIAATTCSSATAPARAGRAAAAAARRAAIVTQAGIPLDVDPGVPSSRCSPSATARQHKSLATIEELCRGSPDGADPQRRRRSASAAGWSPTSPGSPLPSWHRGIAGRARRHDAARHGRRGHRRQDRRQPARRARTSSARSGSRPACVCDLDALATLPPRELRCGLGEMAKYHFLTGDDLLAMDARPSASPAACEIKAEVVSSDEREGGRRALLNYGHTLAHALEIATDYGLAHGEAVAIGLVYAAHLARDSAASTIAVSPSTTPCVGGDTSSTHALPDGVDPTTCRADGPRQEGARRRSDVRPRRARRHRSCHMTYRSATPTTPSAT